MTATGVKQKKAESLECFFSTLYIDWKLDMYCALR